VPPGVLIGAGDIAQCGTLGASLTAAVLDVFAGTVFAAGDIAYNSGTAAEFANCYDPHWGRHKARTRPVPGNHEYQSPGAGPYYDYFGSNAGTDRTGYYSYTVGPWLVLALNSEVDHSDSSAQVGWIRNQLSGFPGRCVAAIWHRPLFSSGPHQGDVDIRPLWRALYDANVDLVINGHEHIYERFGAQDPDGRADPTKGMRQFTVGTGGAALTSVTAVRSNSEVRGVAWGVTEFTLSSAGYAWHFHPAVGFTFSDYGFGECH